MRNIYGGGNMGSVGKGNYAGARDDYSTAGYGEKLTNEDLWTTSYNPEDPNSEPDNAWQFLSSGKSNITITGGTIGYIDTSNPEDYMKDGLPYGNVFGGCRGESAPNIVESPRYLYSPEFYLGYVNETNVIIGTLNNPGPTILGSVYGGGQDGHVRRDATVTINSGEIGSQYSGDGTDLNNAEWLHRGNVYGAGSGIGKYKYDFDYDDAYTSTDLDYNNGRGIVKVNEEDYSTSAGSVTRFTSVTINGGTIHRNVYGGGSLSSIGAPKIGQNYLPYHKDDPTQGHGKGKQSQIEVNILGGNIGDATSLTYSYGGHVLGGSRGDASLASSYSTSIHTKVNISNGNVLGSVFGGGEIGTVKGDVLVDITGGSIGIDVYGGGALANTNTGTRNTANDGWADNTKKSALYKTTVNLLGGTINGDAYGGGLGDPINNKPAQVWGDTKVNLNGIPAGFFPAGIP